MATEWLVRIQDAEKTALVEDGKRKIHYRFTNGDEMAEEYSTSTDVLLRRAWRNKTNIHQMEEWSIEVGDPDTQFSSIDSVGIKETADSPYVVRRVTKTNFEWRIRNLPYPVETYSVTADPESKSIVVRTSNKKYYKKLSLPDLERAGVLPDQKQISFTYKSNTLIITYKKPQQVLDMEKEILQELRSIKTIQGGDLPCKPS